MSFKLNQNAIPIYATRIPPPGVTDVPDGAQQFQLSGPYEVFATMLKGYVNTDTHTVIPDAPMAFVTAASLHGYDFPLIKEHEIKLSFPPPAAATDAAPSTSTEQPWPITSDPQPSGPQPVYAKAPTPTNGDSCDSSGTGAGNPGNGIQLQWLKDNMDGKDLGRTLILLGNDVPADVSFGAPKNALEIKDETEEMKYDERGYLSIPITSPGFMDALGRAWSSGSSNAVPMFQRWLQANTTIQADVALCCMRLPYAVMEAPKSRPWIVNGQMQGMSNPDPVTMEQLRFEKGMPLIYGTLYPWVAGRYDTVIVLIDGDSFGGGSAKVQAEGYMKHVLYDLNSPETWDQAGPNSPPDWELVADTGRHVQGLEYIRDGSLIDRGVTSIHVGSAGGWSVLSHHPDFVDIPSWQAPITPTKEANIYRVFGPPGTWVALQQKIAEKNAEDAKKMGLEIPHLPY